jgi:hypothetical protein
MRGGIETTDCGVNAWSGARMGSDGLLHNTFLPCKAYTSSGWNAIGKLSRAPFFPSLYFQRAAAAIPAQPNASLELTCRNRVQAAQLAIRLFIFSLAMV